MRKQRDARHLVLTTVVGALALVAIALPATATARQAVELGPETSNPGTEDLAGVRSVGEDTVVYLEPGAASRPTVDGSLVLPPSPEAPEGAFGEVVSVRKLDDGRTAVKTAPEPLAAAYSRFNLNLHGYTFDELEARAKRKGIWEGPTVTRRAELSFIDGLKEYLSCDASAEAEGSISTDLGTLEPILHIGLYPKEFTFELRGEPQIIARLKAHGKGRCEPQNLPELVIPLPAYGVPLALTVGPAGKAEVEGDFESTFSWGPRFAVGARMTSAKAVEPIGSIEIERPTPPTVTGSGKASLELGLKVGLSLAGRVGVSGTVGPVIKANFSLSGTSVCTTGTGAGFVELNGEANFFIRHWHFNILRQEFGERELWSQGDCEAAA
jgi:hypothetical protein